MPDSLAFAFGLLDRHTPAFVAAEDFEGVHGPVLKLWQRLGLLANAGEPHPTPSCPHCWEGVPVRLGDRHVCSECLDDIPTSHLVRWRFDLDAFVSWLAASLALDGTPYQVDGSLWQLGTLRSGDHRAECFLCRSSPITPRGRQRLLAYREAVLLRFLPDGEGIDGYIGPCLSLLEVLRLEQGSLRVTGPVRLLREGGRVRFDAESGALWTGDMLLGEVGIGSREFHYLACLAERADRLVSYADLKHEVLRRSGGRDTTDDATFCQKLKSRVKKVIPGIDAVLVATGKGDGYRLRGYVGR